MRKNLIPGICFMLMLGLFALCSCSKTVSEEPQKDVSAPVENKGMAYFEFFDTVTYIYSYAGDSDDIFYDNCSYAADQLDYYHRLFDIYHEYSGINNLCTVNRNAGKDPVKVDRQLIDFLLYAKELCERTDGEMDITMGSVLSIWHEARNSDEVYLPSQEELETASRFMGFEFLEIDERNCTVRLTDPRASLDVGAIGKGYGTEMAARALSEKGASSYVLNVGGNIRIIGTKPDGSSWVTGVRDPKDSNNRLAVRFEIADTSCVTSGTYERFFTVDGVRYPHIIDRKTLWPARYYESVSIITKDSGLADALSTALFCIPYEQSLRMAESFDDVQVIWIFSDGTVKHTGGIQLLD